MYCTGMRPRRAVQKRSNVSLASAGKGSRRRPITSEKPFPSRRASSLPIIARPSRCCAETSGSGTPEASNAFTAARKASAAEGQSGGRRNCTSDVPLGISSVEASNAPSSLALDACIITE
eukprot:6184616-Pleurochrysis_carterae.AAC.2